MATNKLRPPNRALLEKMFDGNHEMIKQYENIFTQDTDFQNQIDSLQAELDATQLGAGLNSNGTYLQPSGSNYLDTSTSLGNADLLLDAAIGVVLILTKTIDYAALTDSQIILVDATSGDLNITLPSPSSFFSGGKSKTIGINKIDTTSNTVNILPNTSELIVGETSQTLRRNSDVLNFITDGTNWYLNN